MKTLSAEYSDMMSVLSGNGQETVVDCGRLSNKGLCPVTYADSIINENNITPLETVLTN